MKENKRKKSKFKEIYRENDRTQVSDSQLQFSEEKAYLTFVIGVCHLSSTAKLCRRVCI